MSIHAPALLLVDLQKGHDEHDYWGGQRNNPQAEATAGKLLQLWREREWPLFHIKHNSTNPQSPFRPGQTGNDFKPEVAPLPGEAVIEKSVNSAFIDTDLEKQLRQAGIHTLVLVGLTTDHCVSTTARMAGNLGFQTYIVADGVACFNKTGPDGENYPAELIHATALASLHQEFATVVNRADLPRYFPL